MEPLEPKVTEVATDAIWRDNIRKETLLRNEFPKRYGFLLAPPSSFIKNQIDSLVDKDRPKVEDILPSSIKPRAVKPAVSVLPSPTTYPKTTTGLIGWRGSREYWLDKYGRYCKERKSIDHQLNWPIDALP